MVSVKANYALHALFDLACQPAGAPAKIAGIAKRREIPRKFLELILSGLRQGGFVESRRGAEGGYLLARPAEQLTVGEVLRHLEGVWQSSSKTKERKESPLDEVWKRVDEAVAEVLDRTTFADLVREWNERQARHIPTWDI